MKEIVLNKLTLSSQTELVPFIIIKHTKLKVIRLGRATRQLAPKANILPTELYPDNIHKLIGRSCTILFAYTGSPYPRMLGCLAPSLTGKLRYLCTL